MTDYEEGCGFFSGGQQQRVAIARALINQPKVLLRRASGGTRPQDAKGYADRIKGDAQETRNYLIYVTHDQEEALILSDTVVVNEGKIQQIGTPTDIYNEPRNCL